MGLGNKETKDPAPEEPQLGTSTTHDAVFGQISEDGPNYRSVGMLATSALMIKTQIGMGILSIPSAFDVLGFIPGVVCLCAVAAITTWSAYIIGVFKLRHREVYGIDDAGALMFGRVGREILGIAFCLYYIFVAGSGMLSISIGLNAVSTHGACTAVFVAVAAIATFLFSSIPTLNRMSWIAWIGVASIMIAVLMVAIAVGVQDRPAAAPQEGVWVSDWKVTNTPSFTDAASAISVFIFAYGGTPSFFSLVAEMRDPRQYPRALLICQIVVTASYLSIGCVLYYFCGSYVASPAMGSAGVTMKKASYGVAIPSLLSTTIIVSHLPSKYVFIRLLRGTKHLTSNTPRHWVTWLACTLATTLVAYVIASGIPIFESLVSLVGALLGTLIFFQPMGCMWLYDNWKNPRSLRWGLMVLWSVFVIVIGTFLQVAGTWGSIAAIIDSYKKSGGSRPWSCADNSNSV